MSLRDNFLLMADYNRWMNQKLYAISAGLTATEIAENRGAFFGSVLGTLNHILVADTIWLQRFANHPGRFEALRPLTSIDTPTRLSQILHHDFAQLCNARQVMDQTIIDFVNQASESDYDHVLNYTNTSGIPHHKNFGHLVQHFFNHQTHHRGQLSTLFNQSGLEVGSTDLLSRIQDTKNAGSH